MMYSQGHGRLNDSVASIGNDERVAERVDRAQLLRRAHVRLPLPARDDLVGQRTSSSSSHSTRCGGVAE